MAKKKKMIIRTSFVREFVKFNFGLP